MADRAGDWQCPNPQCFNHVKMVFGSKSNCPKCGSARDGSAGEAQMGMGMQAQGGFQSGLMIPGVGGCASSDKPTDWQCPNPSCVNHSKLVFGSKANCPKCGMSREGETGPCMGPMGQSGQMPGQYGAGPNPTDWQCPNTSCVNHEKMVFGSKTTCPRCGSNRDGEIMVQPDMMGRVASGMAGETCQRTGPAPTPRA